MFPLSKHRTPLSVITGQCCCATFGYFSFQMTSLLLLSTAMIPDVVLKLMRMIFLYWCIPFIIGQCKRSFALSVLKHSCIGNSSTDRCSMALHSQTTSPLRLTSRTISENGLCCISNGTLGLKRPLPFLTGIGDATV